jgi:transcriptional regulator with XRE-family HTH domain
MAHIPTRLERLRQRLKDRRLYIVAEKTGLSYQTILKIVDGSTANPTINTVESLEAYLGQELPVGQPH